MKKKDRRRLWFALRRYILFFALMAFVISCCMILFLNMLSESMGTEFTQAHIEGAAKVTFANVVFLSVLCTVIDGIRRRVMVEMPVKKIIKAADKMMKGDFSVRIAPGPVIAGRSDFDDIADYFNRMAEELGGMETLREDFIANVSHELKTPLSIIQNYAVMLQSPDLSEENRREYAKAVAETSRRLAELITNILRLNKLENQQIYPAVSAYDLGEQLRECLLSFESQWEAKELEIEADIEEDVTVEADGQLLSLVWNNLLSNAIKFTDDGGKITVSLRNDGPMAIVKVADTGCGIDRETGKHIFEKFYQGDTSRATRGNGLGLALVRRVVEIVGGNISVESQVGKGSVFTIEIRRKQNG